MFCPENNTSKTIPSASNETATSVNWLEYCLRYPLIPPLVVIRKFGPYSI